MTVNTFFKRFQIIVGVFIAVSSTLTTIYVAHKTFFLADVKAQFDRFYVHKAELDVAMKEVSNIKDDVHEIKGDVKEIRTDIKELLKK